MPRPGDIDDVFGLMSSLHSNVTYENYTKSHRSKPFIISQTLRELLDQRAVNLPSNGIVLTWSINSVGQVATTALSGMGQKWQFPYFVPNPADALEFAFYLRNKNEPKAKLIRKLKLVHGFDRSYGDLDNCLETRTKRLLDFELLTNFDDFPLLSYWFHVAKTLRANNTAVEYLNLLSASLPRDQVTSVKLKKATVFEPLCKLYQS